MGTGSVCCHCHHRGGFWWQGGICSCAGGGFVPLEKGLSKSIAHFSILVHFQSVKGKGGGACMQCCMPSFNMYLAQHYLNTSPLKMGENIINNSFLLHGASFHMTGLW